MSKKLLMNEMKSDESISYEILEYIEGTGTQYINTEVVPTLNTKIEAELSISSSTDSYCYFFGSNKILRAGMSYDSSAFRVYKYGASIYKNISPSFLDIKSKFIIDMSDTSKFIEIIIDDSENLSVAFKGSQSTTSTTNPLLIFNAYNDNGSISDNYIGKGRIYSCKIWENGDLIRNFIPVLDNDNIPCLYDSINNKCCYNVGTGSFGYSQ